MNQSRRLLRFGAKLAARGVIARVGLVLAALTSFFFAGRAFVLAHRHVASMYYATSISEAAFVWGAGSLIAFGAAFSTFRRDRKDGTFDLVVLRTGSASAYVWTRVFGLVTLLTIINVANALVVGGACAAAAPDSQIAMRSVWVLGASAVFGVAAAITLGLVYFAALGFTGRAGGYGRLLLVLIGPELVRRLVLRFVESPTLDVMSISAALAGMRESLLPNMVDGAKFVRCLFIVLVVCAGAYAIVRREAARVVDGSAGDA